MAELVVKLTAGCIEIIERGEEIENPVVQVLRYEPVRDKNGSILFYHLIISDGIRSGIVTWLSPALNYLIAEKHLPKNSVVCLEKYTLVEDRHPVFKQFLLIRKLKILLSGDVVGKIIDYRNNHECIDDVQSKASPVIKISTIFPKSTRVAAEMAVKLTPRCIQAMLRDENIENPIVQLLDFKPLEVDNISKVVYRITIYDGTDSFTWGVLPPSLNGLITNGELEPYSVIRLDKYLRIGPCGLSIREALRITRLSILVKGGVVGGMIDSSVSKENSDYSLALVAVSD